MKRGPIFLAGVERSGTSLLYALLASHPNIAMTRRTNLWTFFYKQYGDLSRHENFERCLDAMLRYKRLLKLSPDAERLRREFWQGEPSYPRLFALLEEHYAEQLGKPRWGDKSLNTELYVDDIFAAYPNAYMLHLIRDPRDRYASALTRWKVIRGRAGSGIARWLRSVEQAQRNQQRYPDRYMVVRYETLVQAPEQMLRQICEFVGEEYAPAMLTMDGAPVHRDKGGNSSYEKRRPGQISASSVGRFRRVLSKQEVAFMQRYAAGAMAAYDYAPEPISWSVRERIAFACLAWPSNCGRLLAWYGVEAWRSAKGRAPSQHTIVSDRRVMDGR